MALAAETMILGPVSYLDCVVFCALSAPQLIWHAGLLETVLCALGALPFLCESQFRHAHFYDIFTVFIAMALTEKRKQW